MIDKITSIYREKGAPEVFLKILGKAGLDWRMQTLMTKHRRHLSREVMKIFNNTVASGPFKGMKLPICSAWGQEDQAVRVLGIYEREVQNEVVKLTRQFKTSTFIDLGGADGYYAIGVLVNDLYPHSIVYETTVNGRETIARAARLNYCADRVTIKGTAKPGFLSELKAEGLDLNNCLFLFDIEGEEFDLLTTEVLEHLSNSVLIVEVHDFTATQKKAAQKLEQQAAHHFNVRTITTGSRNPGKFKELANLTDHDRWLLMSEGRGKLMYWLVLTPKFA